MSLSQYVGSYTLDPAHSRIGFVARHAMITKVRGAFNEFSGTATLADPISDSSVNVVIETASIDTRQQQRDEHLRSADFFDTAQFPQITFTSTSVTESNEGLEVTGDLTINDVTRSLTIPFSFEGGAVDPFGNHRVGFEGSVVVNRKDFGLTWNAALEAGGMLVSEKVTLEFEISAIKAN